MARELAPAGVRSAPIFFGAATHSSGSKLPRHRCVGLTHGVSRACRRFPWCHLRRCQPLCGHLA
ncbi:hypothetical protein CER19_27240 [Pseudomonas sp. GL93]|nr:hypothetical protein CER19_27240 [Pseudomonas sp. GL93]